MDRGFNPAVEFLIEDRPRKFPWVNVALFLSTCFTTLVVGTLLMEAYDGTLGDDPWIELARLWGQPSTLVKGLPFSIAIMTILFAHEMGHYLTCRRYGIDASLPYFIPFPNPVGTMGAFIRIRSPIYDRGSLLDVGVSGPIAGFVFAVAALALSVTASRFVPYDPEPGALGLGEPLIFKLIVYVMGQTPPPGMELYIHPVAFAAWFGFFATALNLLPVGQLDGGHITYALFRGGHRWISRAVAAILLPLGIFYWPGWLLWFLLLLIIKLRHPPTIDDSIPLKRQHIVRGWIGIILLALCFTPAPFTIE